MENEITATFRIVTPMFIGGAEHEASGGVRPPSFKGALRFWWRALNWGRFRRSSESDAEALRELNCEEARLFGAAAKVERGRRTGGQGVFQLALNMKEVKKGWRNGLEVSHAYLLGQGLWHYKDGLLRDALSEGCFEVRLFFRPTASSKDRQSVVRALKCLGLLGGLGSRSRRGWGSISIEKWSLQEELPSDVPSLIECFREFMDSVDGLPPFSAFSSRASINVSKEGENALKLLSSAGEQMQLFRSYGRKDSSGKHCVNGKEAEQNFADDHDLIWNAAVHGRCPDRLPKRIVFGLPHNYYFSSISNRKEASVGIAPLGDKRGRRASPLLIHVHRFPNGSCALVQTLFPSTFLPSRDRVGIDAKRLKNCSLPGTKVDFAIIEEYLKRFENRKVVRFPQEARA